MKEFVEYAKSLTKAVENEYTRLHDKKISLETELAEINKRIALIEPKKKRIGIYKPEQMLCPVCFIDKDLSVEMKPVPSESTSDIFRCPHCSSEIEVEN